MELNQVKWLAGLGMVLFCLGVRAGERPLSETIRAAADAVRPAVVGIEVKGRAAAAPREFQNLPFGRVRPGQPRDWQWHFEWPPRDRQPGEAVPPVPPVLPFDQVPFLRHGRQPAEGTGLIMEVEGERGLIAAPQELVAGAEAVFVKLSDGRQLAAKVLGTDRATDMACLEVRDPKLMAAKVTKGPGVQVGDWVLALGGPASGNAVTIGVVSTKPHAGGGELAGTMVFQADITLAEGMAGGPLVNLNGEVVGLTASQRGGQGRELASAVPIGTAHDTLRALAKEGKVRRGWLGLMLQPLDPEALRQLKIDAGIQVGQAMEGQPAAKAGVQAGDVILEINGRKATDVETFRAIVSGMKPGERATLKLLRAGKGINVEVTLGEQGAEVGGGEPAAPQGGEKLDLGLSLQPLTPDLAAQFGFEGDKGLLVTDVAADSPAAKARPAPIARGELIKEIARKPVATLADAKAAIEEARKAKEKTVLVLVRSKEGARYVVVDLAQ